MSEAEIRKIAFGVAVRLGYSSLKDKQMDVIVNFLLGKDVFGVLQTGYRKSLCYACLPWIFDELYREKDPSIVIVISPLTAIMIDQVIFIIAKFPISDAYVI